MERVPRRPSRRVDRDLRAIGALTQAVLDGHDLEQLLGRVAAEARVLVAAKFGVVVTVAGDPGVMTFRAVDGLIEGPLRVGHTMPVRDTLTELAITSGSNIVAHGPAELPVAGRAFAAATGAGPVIAAPLIAMGPARGVLVIAGAAGDPPFRPGDAQLISTFAAQAAAAIELSELRSAEDQLVVGQERRRIATVLTEGVLAALPDLVRAVRALADTTPDPRLAAAIRDSAHQLDDAITTVAAYVRELAAIRPAGPQPRTARVVERTSRRPATATHLGAPDTVAAIGSLARASVTNGAIDDVLHALVDGIAEQVSAESGLLGTVTEDGAHVLVKVQVGPELPGRHIGAVIPIGQTLVGEVIALGRPIVLESARSSPSVPDAVSRRVGPVVAVRLSVGNRAFGALVIARPVGADRFHASEVRLIEAYAAQAAIALEFERVREELRQGSVFAERDRIGRELHERVLQLLFRASLALDAVEGRVRDAPAQRSLRASVDGLDRAIRDLRRYLLDLEPHQQDDPRPAPGLEDLAADNARLQGEIAAQLEEVRASRARIVAAGDAERKRVERDLHDGAQQRLVSLTLALRLARARLGEDLDPSARLSLDQASEDARAAMAELRELARGIHPQILTEAGLQGAVDALAARSPVPVSVDIAADRFPSGVEGAAYFTVSEALTNVAKYADASLVLVRGEWHDDWLVVEIEDDGVGGADSAVGTGLRGLADRLAAINGTLDVVSPRGGGTRVVARIPTPDPVAADLATGAMATGIGRPA